MQELGSEVTMSMPVVGEDVYVWAGTPKEAIMRVVAYLQP